MNNIIGIGICIDNSTCTDELSIGKAYRLYPNSLDPMKIRTWWDKDIIGRIVYTVCDLGKEEIFYKQRFKILNTSKLVEVLYAS